MDRKDQSASDVSEAQSKLSLLLEIENENEAMLERARLDAAALLERARSEAEERVQRADSQLEQENRELAGRIARERDEAIDSIRTGAQDEARRLDALDESTVAELARYVVELLVGTGDSGGSS